MNVTSLAAAAIFLATPLIASCAALVSEAGYSSSELACREFKASTCGGHFCLIDRASNITLVTAKEIKINNKNKLEDVGIFDYEDLAEESVARVSRKPQSGKVILDSAGWPHPIESEQIGTVLALSAGNLQCTDTANGERDKSCHVTVATIKDKKPLESVYYVSSVTGDGEKQLMTTKMAQLVAHCAIANRFRP